MHLNIALSNNETYRFLFCIYHKLNAIKYILIPYEYFRVSKTMKHIRSVNKHHQF